MKRIIQIAGAVAIIAGMTGCATPAYLADRGHDLADVFTVSIGHGGGARVRVGPFHSGLLLNMGNAGLHGGEITESGGHENTLGEFIGIGGESFNPWERHEGRGKSFYTENMFPFVTTDLQPGGGMVRDLYPYYYYTQLEVTAGLLFNLHLGFNPGELLDFILGWTTIDILNDDLSRIKIQKQLDQERADRVWKESYYEKERQRLKEKSSKVP